MRRPNKCVGKKKYNYRHKAEQASLRSYIKRQVPTRVYECPTCLHFHLTSKSVELSRIEELARKAPKTPAENKRLRKRRYRNKRALINKATIQFLTHFYGNTRLLTIRLTCGLLKK